MVVYAKKNKSGRKRPKQVRVRRRVRTRKAVTSRSTYPRYSALPGLPSVKNVILPYHMEYVTSVGSTITSQTFNSANAHDPDYTGTGHQPRGWDQYKAFYKSYRVTACSIKATFFWEETPSQSHSCGIYIDDDSTFAFSNTNDLYEKNGKKTRHLLPDRTNKVVLSEYVNLSKCTNKALMTQRTAVGSSPSEAAPFIHVWSIANNTATLSYGPVRVHCQLHYHIQLFEPVDITGS